MNKWPIYWKFEISNDLMDYNLGQTLNDVIFYIKITSLIRPLTDGFCCSSDWVECRKPLQYSETSFENAAMILLLVV